MFMVMINRDLCTGCKDCQELCPSDLLGMVDGKAEVTGEAGECMGCESCTAMCPAGAITLSEF